MHEFAGLNAAGITVTREEFMDNLLVGRVPRW